MIKKRLGKSALKNIKVPIVIFFLLLVPGTTWSSTFREVEVTCPLCNTKFKTHLQMSGSTFSQRLDLKPLGAISAPWPLAVCPKDAFVLYKENFSDKEKERLRPYVSSKTYQDLADYPSYFRLAKIFEFLGEDEYTIGYTYVKASWEAERIPAQNGSYQPALEAALSHLKKYLLVHREKDKKWETAELLSGEMERRLGRFDEALKHFKGLKALPEFQTKLFSKIIKLQLELIEKKDSQPQEIPRDALR